MNKFTVEPDLVTNLIIKTTCLMRPKRSPLFTGSLYTYILRWLAPSKDHLSIEHFCVVTLNRFHRGTIVSCKEIDIHAFI